MELGDGLMRFSRGAMRINGPPRSVSGSAYADAPCIRACVDTATPIVVLLCIQNRRAREAHGAPAIEAETDDDAGQVESRRARVRRDASRRGGRKRAAAGRRLF